VAELYFVKPDRSAVIVHLTGRLAEPLLRRLAAAGVRMVDRPGGDALEVVVGGRAHAPSGGAAWIWLTPAPSRPAVAAAAAAGALDVVDSDDPAAEVAARIVARAQELHVPPEPTAEAPEFVAESAAARHLLAELHHAARTSMPVLLTGETGTGKDVAAKLLHGWSSRRSRRFVPINCAAIPNEMLEAELFGYARGAFSGAVAAYDGQLAAAEGGSVFLDEVDDTPLSFQVKLLRVLEDRVVSRLGENEWRKVNFRVIAASNRELRELITRGQFGPDLYERLAIVSIRLPPLRNRLDDLPGLCRLLIARFYRDEPVARERHQVDRVTPEAMALLAGYGWPGNIRELRNVLYGALVRKRCGHELLVSDLPRRMLVGAAGPTSETGTGSVIDGARIDVELGRGTFNLRASLEALEREAVGRALERTGGNAAGAAALLGEVGRGAARDPGATVRAMARRLGLSTRR
jgi:transcriptional regulator with GAF, ATPase, and Fis domain